MNLELEQLLKDAHDHDQQSGAGRTHEESHESEFRSTVVAALKNLALCVVELEAEVAELRRERARADRRRKAE